MIPTFKRSLLAFGFLCIVFGVIGGTALSRSNTLNEYLIRYDDRCVNQTTCSVTFSLPFDLVNPKVYYKLDNFYANHRNFVKSRNFKQLRGDATYPADDAQIITSCSPLVYNKDMDDTAISIVNNSLNPNMIASPCGIIANYHFNDTFKIFNSHKS